MPTSGYGMLGHLLFSTQDSFGTAANSWHAMTIISETIITAIETLREEGMRARFDRPDAQEGFTTVAGDISFEPHPVLVGYFVRAVIGDPVTTFTDSVGAGGLASHVFTPPQTDFTPGVVALPPYTLQVDRNSTNAWQFTDTVVDKLTFEITAGQLVKCTASIISRVSSLMTTASPTFPTGAALAGDGITVTVSGTVNSDWTDMTITIMNNTGPINTLSGEKLASKILRTGFREIDVTGNVCFNSETEYDQFVARAQNTFQAKFTSTLAVAAGSAATITIDLPKMLYGEYSPNMGGPEQIVVPFAATAEYSTGDSYAVLVTMVNTEETYTV